MPVVDILKLTQILQNIIKAKSLMRVQILDPAFIILQHFMTPKFEQITTPRPRAARPCPALISKQPIALFLVIVTIANI